MNTRQINREIVAARAARRTAVNLDNRTVGTNPALRIDRVPPGGNPRRHRNPAPMSGSGNKGYTSEWAMPIEAPYGGWR